MNYLNSIEVDNLIVFDHAKFDIKPGLSIIRGINNDSTAKKATANGTGKSLLFGAFANCVLHAPPMADKKNTANTFMPDKASIKLNLKTRQGNVFIKQQAEKKQIKYEIVVNNKPQKTRTATEMRKAVTSILPISDAIIYSTVLVSSFRPSILWLGTSAQRYDFFEDIAELGFYDVMAAKISKKISEIKLQEKLSTPWADELADLRKEYSGKQQLRDIKAQIKIISQERETLRVRQRNAQKHYAKFDDIPAQKTKLKFKTPRQAFAWIKQAKLECKKLANKGSGLSKEYKQLQATKELQRPYKKWQKQIAQLPDAKYTAPKLKKRVKQYTKQLLSLEQDRLYVAEHYDDYLLYQAKKLRKMQGAIPTQADIDLLEKQVALGKHERVLLHDLHKTGTCPICLSRPKNIRKTDSKKSLSLEKQLEQYKLLAVKHRIESNKKLKPALKRMDTIPAIKDKLLRAKELLSQVQARDLLLQHPIKKPLKFSKSRFIKLGKKLDVTHTQFTKIKARIEQFENNQAYYQTMANVFGKDVNLASLQTQAKKARKKYEIAQNALNNIDDQLVSLKTQLASVKLARKAYNALNKKYKASLKIQSELSDWQILHKMYGPTGMRIAHMQSIVNSYVQYLNNMAPLVYSEPFEFSSKLEGRNFQLLVNRHGHPSDVRYLSGAQSRFFLALSAIALRKILPASKQFNFLLMDEIDAGVSTGEFHNFTYKFLPYLLEEIPSIIIITPKNRSEWMADNATDYVFTRNKGKTTIKTEMQLQLRKAA